MPPEPKPDKLAAAIGYVRRGWAVLPCRPGGKEPLTRHGLYDATTDPQTVTRWWHRWPEANIAIHLGRSRLIVLDVDGEAGWESLRALERKYGELPTTVAALTGRGGHFYFRCPPGFDGNGRIIGEGLELRTGTAYVIAPPSRHPNGKQYVWEASGHPDDLEPADPPQWLLSLVRTRARPPADRKHVFEGERNLFLTRVAGGLRADGLSAEAIERQLLAVNKERCRPPLPEAEVRQVARSVGRYPPAPTGEVVRIPKSLLCRGLSRGAMVLYATRQAIRQVTGAVPRQKALAETLGVTTRTIKSWWAEVKAAGLAYYERPKRRFASVPASVLCDAKVSHEAKVAAMYLAFFVSPTGWATVGLRTLARRMGVSERTARRLLGELKARGHLHVSVAKWSPELARRERCNRYAFLALTPQSGTGLKAKKGKQVTYSKPPPRKKGKYMTHISIPGIYEGVVVYPPYGGAGGDPSRAVGSEPPRSMRGPSTNNRRRAKVVAVA